MSLRTFEHFAGLEQHQSKKQHHRYILNRKDEVFLYFLYTSQPVKSITVSQSVCNESLRGTMVSSCRAPSVLIGCVHWAKAVITMTPKALEYWHRLNQSWPTITQTLAMINSNIVPVTASMLTWTLSASSSGRCHFSLDRMPKVTNPKATMRRPREFTNFASAGSEL